MPHRRTAKLASWQFWLLTVSGGGLLASGAGWLMLHYFWPVQGEFGLEPNPLEPWLIRLHGLMLIPALLAIGGLFVAHVPKGWDHKRQRVAGVALGSVLMLLIITGYMLYYVGIEEIRPWVSLIHWVIGLTLPILSTWHYLNARAARRKRQSKRPPTFRFPSKISLGRRSAPERVTAIPHNDDNPTKIKEIELA